VSATNGQSASTNWSDLGVQLVSWTRRPPTRNGHPKATVPRPKSTSGSSSSPPTIHTHSSRIYLRFVNLTQWCGCALLGTPKSMSSLDHTSSKLSHLQRRLARAKTTGDKAAVVVADERRAAEEANRRRGIDAHAEARALAICSLRPPRQSYRDRAVVSHIARTRSTSVGGRERRPTPTRSRGSRRTTSCSSGSRSSSGDSSGEPEPPRRPPARDLTATVAP
jgi:hypothetical protein